MQPYILLNCVLEPVRRLNSFLNPLDRLNLYEHHLIVFDIINTNQNTHTSEFLKWHFEGLGWKPTNHATTLLPFGKISKLSKQKKPHQTLAKTIKNAHNKSRHQGPLIENTKKLWRFNYTGFEKFASPGFIVADNLFCALFLFAFSLLGVVFPVFFLFFAGIFLFPVLVFHSLIPLIKIGFGRWV